MKLKGSARLDAVLAGSREDMFLLPPFKIPLPPHKFSLEVNIPVGISKSIVTPFEPLTVKKLPSAKTA